MLEEWNKSMTEISKQSNQHQKVLDFQKCMGQLLGLPSHQLILQHLSEVMEFTPPSLTEFEKKIQAAAWKQMQDFFSDLDWKLPPSPIDRIKHRIQSDIELFNKQEVKDAFVNELECYYLSRANSLSVS